MIDSIPILAGGRGATITRKLAVLSRQGRPFLYLPRRGNSASHALSLYPAQRRQARAFRALLRYLCTGGLVGILPSRLIRIGKDTPLAEFLGSLVGESDFPEVAILAGNPNAPGRRFIILVFDGQSRPQIVVKAGAGTKATQLIGEEQAVLEAAPATAKGIPRIRAAIRDEGVQAIALDYIRGASPRGAGPDQMRSTLGSWIDLQRQVAAREVPAWQRLNQRCAASDIFRRLHSNVEARVFHPVLHHGDFAPWNIKASPTDGTWQVLDWERGECVGLPGWDWFHYHIQTGILVEHLTAKTHANRIEDWLGNAALQSYARSAGVHTLLRELLLAYLLHTIEVTRPSEGLPAAKELLNVLDQRWLSV